MLKDIHIIDHVFMTQSLMLPKELGGGVDKSELYRQCSPRRVLDPTIEDLEKCECVSSVIKIIPVLGV